jgi:HSP20 family protein
MAMLPVRRSGGRNLTIVNPSREFEDIYDRMGQLMNVAFGVTPAELIDTPWSPLADLSETDDAYVVQVDLPGVHKDQVQVQLQDRELVITGGSPNPSVAAAIAVRAAPAGSSSAPTCPVTSTPTR